MEEDEEEVQTGDGFVVVVQKRRNRYYYCCDGRAMRGVDKGDEEMGISGHDIDDGALIRGVVVGRRRPMKFGL